MPTKLEGTGRAENIVSHTTKEKFVVVVVVVVIGEGDSKVLEVV